MSKHIVDLISKRTKFIRSASETKRDNKLFMQRLVIVGICVIGLMVLLSPNSTAEDRRPVLLGSFILSHPFYTMNLTIDPINGKVTRVMDGVEYTVGSIATMSGGYQPIAEMWIGGDRYFITILTLEVVGVVVRRVRIGEKGVEDRYIPVLAELTRITWMD